MIIVTAASSNHFGCLKNLLYTISGFEPDTRTIIYDIGLTEAESKEISSKWEVGKFQFELYPDWIRLGMGTERGRRSGAYAWKASIIADILELGTVLWMDAGNLVMRPLTKIREVLKHNTVYSPTSAGTIAQWTDPRTIEYLRTPDEYLRRSNRNGALIGVTQQAISLVENWENCCLTRECIEPKGVTQKTHRYDQAILSILLYRYQWMTGIKLEDKAFGVKIHNDKLTLPQVEELLDRTSGDSTTPKMRSV